jgi:hypothetical protein
MMSWVVFQWFKDGVLSAMDGAPSRSNPDRHRGNRRGTALLVGCGSSKRSGGVGERESGERKRRIWESGLHFGFAADRGEGERGMA